jgi:hypothetical protein
MRHWQIQGSIPKPLPENPGRRENLSVFVLTPVGVSHYGRPADESHRIAVSEFERCYPQATAFSIQHRGEVIVVLPETETGPPREILKGKERNESMKSLYKVTTKGVGDYYTIADDPTSAQNTVIKKLMDKAYGVFTDHDVTRIEHLGQEFEFNHGKLIIGDDKKLGFEPVDKPKAKPVIDWIPVAERLPEPDPRVLDKTNVIVRVESYDRGPLRTIGCYIHRWTVEIDIDWSEDDPDYDEETQAHYCAPGWYEPIPFEHRYDIGYSHERIHGTVTHWAIIRGPEEAK